MALLFINSLKPTGIIIGVRIVNRIKALLISSNTRIFFLKKIKPA